MAKKEFRSSIRVKTILLIVIFGAILAEIAMIYFSLVSSNQNKENYKNNATDLADTIALTIDKQKVKDLTNDIISIYDASDKPIREEHEGTPELEAYLASFDAIKETQNYKDIQNTLYEVKNANRDVDSVYLGYVDYDRKVCVYLVYDEENEYFPTGIIDPLYEEDYPLIDDHKLGFVASIYVDEVEGISLVTAGAPIVDENDEVISYVLVDISMAKVRRNQADDIVRLFIYLMSTVVVLCIVGIIFISIKLLKPVNTLKKAVNSYDSSNPENTHKIFTELKVNVHDEFLDLARGMQKMENDIYDKFHELTLINEELKASQLETQKMTELANKDALTGVRNKIAYNHLVEELNRDIAENKPIKFGIAMVDLNYLKVINDEYGHNNGDAALIKLCNIICSIFAHSPVYRVGGDEFVIILRNRDYQRADILIAEFNSKIEELGEDDDLLPSEKVSAAIGYAKFDPKTDKEVEDVFKKADQAMYLRKRKMKNED